MGLQNIGDLAMDEKRFTEAEQRYRDSLSQFEAINFRLGVASAYYSLGAAVAVDPRQHRLGREHFRRALSVATDIGAVPVSLEALVGLASLASAKETHREKAAEWLGHVIISPAGKHDTKENARKLLKDLALEVGQERIDKAVRRGEAQDLDQILIEASAK